ncbi:MAG: hypothetical protein HY280_07715 [Nitrospinae bacterium]|nr:hypothetical protein [Nitrospinota bacterium]
MADEKKDENSSAWRKAESLIFPISAAFVGIGYAAAILLNNNLEKVARSPYALILLVAFGAIIFFSVRTLYWDVKGGRGDSAQ